MLSTRKIVLNSWESQKTKWENLFISYSNALVRSFHILIPLIFFFQKKSQILPGGGLEEHCWDNVLVALVLLNFRRPTVPSSCPQYHAVADSVLQSSPQCPPPARILFPKRGFLFPCLTEEPRIIIITIFIKIFIKITYLTLQWS